MELAEYKKSAADVVKAVEALNAALGNATVAGIEVIVETRGLSFGNTKFIGVVVRPLLPL